MDFNKEMALQDQDFKRFIAQVSPLLHNGQQPVLWSEFFGVLQLLWQIYNFLKEKNFVSRYLGKREVAQAMAENVLPEDRVEALTKIRDEFLQP